MSRIERDVSQDSALGRIALEALYEVDVVGPPVDLSDVSVRVSQVDVDGPVEVSFYDMNTSIPSGHPRYDEARKLLADGL